MMTVTSLPAWRGAELDGLLVDHDPAAFVDAAAGGDGPGGQRRRGQRRRGGAGAVHPGGALGGDGAGPGAGERAVGDGVHEVPV
jgi:hypothetical protein